MLGIDAAWTERQPSGVALVAETPAGWRCVAVAPGYAAFLRLAGGVPVDWRARPAGSRPEPAALLHAAEILLKDGSVRVVAVDMPLATVPITGRRMADAALARAFGGRGCATHSPTTARPGPISTRLVDGFAAAGFQLATAATPARAFDRLIEVYPHPAVLRLLDAGYRVPYKSAGASRYWRRERALTPVERRQRLLATHHTILRALQQRIQAIGLELPSNAADVSLAGLKRYEDALDALICAWVGMEYLAGRAKAYGDGTAAIWVPDGQPLAAAPAS